MNFVTKIISGIFFIGLIGGLLFYLGADLQNASLEKFDLSGISDIGATSFTFNGNLYVNNPSKLDVPVKTITYEVFLESGEKIGSGDFAGFTLKKEDVTQIPFEQELNWVPTAQLATQLVTKDKVIVEVRGELFIDLPKLENFEIPFSAQTDIKEYIMQFVPVEVDTPVDAQDTIDSVNKETNQDSLNRVLTDSESTDDLTGNLPT